MSAKKCHWCGANSFLIVFSDSEGVCPHCYLLLSPIFHVMPLPLREPGRQIEALNLYQPLDSIVAELMSMFLTNGMSVSNLARQMGITRATIYSKLKKYELAKTELSNAPTINLTTADIQISGLHRRKIKSVLPDKFRPSDRYCDKLALSYTSDIRKPCQSADCQADNAER